MHYINSFFLTQVEKVHLGDGVYIKHETWKLLKFEKKDSLFVKNLSLAMWSREALANRCIEFKDDLRSIPNRSPRKLLTPEKVKVVNGIK